MNTCFSLINLYGHMLLQDGCVWTHVTLVTVTGPAWLQAAWNSKVLESSAFCTGNVLHSVSVK